MPRMALIFGLALIVVGLFGYYLASANDSKPWTALIPAIPGALLLICGFLSRNEKMRMIFMHIAVAVALLGAIASGVLVGKAAFSSAELARPLAFAMQTLMFALCGGFSVLAIISFIRARSDKAQEEEPLA